MSLWALASSLVGGLGLFLLGMTMMTDGLKLAAGPALTLLHNAFVQHTGALLALCDPQAPHPGTVALDAASAQMEAAYEELKSALLAAGAVGGARLSSMEEALRRYSALLRAAQQATKARRRCQRRDSPWTEAAAIGQRAGGT